MVLGWWELLSRLESRLAFQVRGLFGFSVRARPPSKKRMMNGLALGLETHSIGAVLFASSIHLNLNQGFGRSHLGLDAKA